LDAKQKINQGQALNLHGMDMNTSATGDLHAYATAYAEPIAYAEHVATYDEKSAYY